MAYSGALLPSMNSSSLNVCALIKRMIDKSWSEALVYVEDKNEILSSKDSHFQEGISAARLELNLKAEVHRGSLL